jgi:hypothetical protein
MSSMVAFHGLRRASISPYRFDDPTDLAQAKCTRAVTAGLVSDLPKHLRLGYGETESRS